jgi:hypothetical protein
VDRVDEDCAEDDKEEEAERVDAVEDESFPVVADITAMRDWFVEEVGRLLPRPKELERLRFNIEVGGDWMEEDDKDKEIVASPLALPRLVGWSPVLPRLAT